MGTATEAPALKDRFRNDSGGIVGAVIEKPGGGYKGVPVYPGDTIDLDEVEQAMTANGPRDPAQNPLANGALTCISEGLDFKERRPTRPDPSLSASSSAPEIEEPDAGHLSEETATVVTPDAEPPQGSFAEGEETGAPDASAPPEPETEEVTGREAARKGPPASAAGQPRPRPAPRPKGS